MTLLCATMVAADATFFGSSWFSSPAQQQQAKHAHAPEKEAAQWYQQGGIEWQSCGDAADLVQNLQIATVPWPPVAGQNLVIEAAADLKEPLLQGARADVVVKWNYIKFPAMSVDICDKMKVRSPFVLERLIGYLSLSGRHRRERAV